MITKISVYAMHLLVTLPLLMSDSGNVCGVSEKRPLASLDL